MAIHIYWLFLRTHVVYGGLAGSQRYTTRCCTPSSELATPSGILRPTAKVTLVQNDREVLLNMIHTLLDLANIWETLTVLTPNPLSPKVNSLTLRPKRRLVLERSLSQLSAWASAESVLLAPVI